MTVAQVEAFFECYAQAFTRLDVAAVCDLWAYPAYIASPDNRTSLTEAEFRSNTHALCDFYKRQGMASANARVLDVLPLTDNAASVRTAYELRDNDGTAIAKWVHGYLLSETRDGLRIVASLPDEEIAVWNARGAALAPR